MTDTNRSGLPDGLTLNEIQLLMQLVEERCEQARLDKIGEDHPSMIFRQALLNKLRQAFYERMRSGSQDSTSN